MASKCFFMFPRIPRSRARYACLAHHARWSHIVGDSARSQRTSPAPPKMLARTTAPVAMRMREIRVTNPNRALHPILILLLRPIVKVLVIVFGRGIRKWWRKLSPEEKQDVVDQIRTRQPVIFFLSSFSFFVFVLYYFDHVYEAPVTKRKRFMMLSSEQLNKIADLEYQAQVQKYRSDIVPPSHPFYQRTFRVANKILRSNSDIPEVLDKNWSLTVVDRPEITNAFSFPHGKIFVFTGLLNVCSNDDQLAIVLSHEVSHTIMSHVAESMSKMFLIEAVLIIPSIICWASFTDLWAIISEWISNGLANILIRLPFSRSIEREADYVGMHLAAKSCYDVREAPVFWAKMNVVNHSPFPPVEWFSTHPSDETRQTHLKELLPAALKLRESNSCPPLKSFSWGFPQYGEFPKYRRQ